ncbi:hypothetical protein [Candidatus Stoquefichus sp. SB1]|uniref:hypothetical protein n=1 Tax=Candidatus Stoquefichus sp. SB1 TaxID=1658109 RepID=UPI00067F3211|nr:hypothetical protein [Candidatus Stoquefichus sp. SB1]
MNEEMNSLLKITELAYKVSTAKKADVFVNYAPHVNNVDVVIHKEGYSEDNESQMYFVYLDNRYRCIGKTLHTETVIKMLEDMLNE